MGTKTFRGGLLVALVIGTFFSLQSTSAFGAEQSPAVSERHEVTAYKNGVIQHTRVFSFATDVEVPVTLKVKNDPRDIGFVKATFAFSAQGGATLSQYLHDMQLAEADTLVIDPNSPLESVLRQAKGAIVIVKDTSGTQLASGTLMGISSHEIPSEKGAVQQKLVEVKTSGGLQQIPLTPSIVVSFVDRGLEGKVDNSLQQAFRAIDRSTAELQFAIKGSAGSSFTVNYFEPGAAPKTSYRFMQSGNKDNTAIEMQLYVHVTNATKQGWDNVKFRYVNGSPNVFATDIALLRQPEYDFVQLVENRAQGNVQAYGPLAESAPRSFRRSPAADAQADAAPQEAAPSGMSAAMAAAPAVASDTAGDFTSYSPADAISIAPGESLEIPVESKEVPQAALVLIYQPTNGNKFFSGVRFKNPFNKTLAKGPVTLYQSGNLVGGQNVMNDLAPDEERIAAFSPERRVLGKSELKNNTSVRSALRIADGVLVMADRQTLQTGYEVTNKSDEDFILRIDHQGRLGQGSKFSCAEKPDAIEAASNQPNACCVQVPIAAGETVNLTITEEAIRQTKIVFNENDGAYEYFNAYVASTSLPFVADANLQSCIALAKQVGAAKQELQTTTEKLAGLRERANEVRQNLASVPGDTSYQARLRKYTDEIDSIVDSKQPELKAKITALQTELREKLSALTFSWSERN